MPWAQEIKNRLDTPTALGGLKVLEISGMVAAPFQVFLQ